MNSPIRIMVVDDHPLLREGVCITLESDPSFKVVGQAESYDQALNSVAQANPDIMLIDVSMPGGGINTAQEIHQLYPHIKIIMLTVSEDEKDVSTAIRAGARGYILKGIGGKDLIQAVHRIARGESFITPSLATSILLQAHTQAPNKGSKLLDKLSKREAVILKALERGLTNRQIADELDLSEKTVKHYMTIILKKLRVKNRVEAALMAQKHEFLE